MPFYYTPYIILPLLSALVNGALAVKAGKLRNIPAASRLFWVMLGCSGWSLSYALNTASTALDMKEFFLKCGFTFGSITLINLPLLFLALMGLTRLINRWSILLFAVIPLISTTLNWIPELQVFFRSDFHLVQTGNLLLISFVEGFWYKLHFKYLYVLQLLIFLLALWFIFRSSRVRRNSLILALVGMFLPLLTDILPYSPANEFSMATSVLFLTGLCFWWAALRHHLLDLVPIAREKLFEEMHEPVLIMDSHCRMAAINNAASQLGLEQSSVGLSLVELFPLGTPLYSLASLENNGVLHDLENNRWWRISRKELYKDNEHQGALLVLHDITPLQQLQIELEESKKHLVVSLAAEQRARGEQERFLDMIAHEYRTPLAIIQVNHDILGIASLDIKQQEKSLATMSQGIRRLKEIFDSYLQKSDFERKLELNLAPLDGAHFIRKILSEAEALWGKRFALTCDNETPLIINADQKLLKTVILNLLDNAAKYSPPSDTVALTTELTDREMIFVCENSLASSGEIDIPQIFNKFYRGKNIQGTSGSGVGLYLVSKIIEEHGGSAEVEICAQEGFRITIRLPRLKGEISK
ncbi:MAG: histidine kinase N-terminal 7TM domain-containing protein [Methylobacter sp.]|nr:histidine kinase N-terminal 7TM domain-containing protein [Methylobacter sp.]MDP2098205.1 histidine kinase N-terminal 7TM domain-containing protein [Methylobacter sp.]MDP2429930.1 histidine kinase N-terminal 7TM domain-containing protein [Methylobacter sp.]MDP3056090.1 histidine kinase N-terminal 7TM domain-containing protein [Methylobacter sp.]MDP3362859.1 histidine kinase N-terminal 7TM domain-containing protein [Methylobacter sp.]